MKRRGLHLRGAVLAAAFACGLVLGVADGEAQSVTGGRGMTTGPAGTGSDGTSTGTSGSISGQGAGHGMGTSDETFHRGADDIQPGLDDGSAGTTPRGRFDPRSPEEMPAEQLKGNTAPANPSESDVDTDMDMGLGANANDLNLNDQLGDETTGLDMDTAE